MALEHGTADETLLALLKRIVLPIDLTLWLLVVLTGMFAQL